MKKQESMDKLKQKVKEIKQEAREKEHKLKECKKETKKADDKDKKITELTDTLQRLQAEFENYKKYIEKQSADFKKYAKADLIINILPILDSFELALKNTSDSLKSKSSNSHESWIREKEKFVKGVELIYSQLFSALEKEGLKPIKAEGQKLDPIKHEVLLKEKSDKEEDTILEELQKGYLLDEKVIRHSKVKVSKK
jgi:molecular chaperone GrpE